MSVWHTVTLIGIFILIAPFIVLIRSTKKELAKKRFGLLYLLSVAVQTVAVISVFLLVPAENIVGGRLVVFYFIHLYQVYLIVAHLNFRGSSRWYALFSVFVPILSMVQILVLLLLKPKDKNLASANMPREE